MCVCPECDREFTAIEQFGRFQQRHRGRQRRRRRAGGEGGSISGNCIPGATPFSAGGDGGNGTPIVSPGGNGSAGVAAVNSGAGQCS